VFDGELAGIGGDWRELAGIGGDWQELPGMAGIGGVKFLLVCRGFTGFTLALAELSRSGMIYSKSLWAQFCIDMVSRKDCSVSVFFMGCD